MELKFLAFAPKFIILSVYGFFLHKDTVTGFFIVFVTVLVGYLFNRVQEAEKAADKALNEGVKPATPQLKKVSFVGSVYKGLIVSLFISLFVLSICIKFKIGAAGTIIIALVASSRPKLLEEFTTNVFRRITKNI